VIDPQVWPNGYVVQFIPAHDAVKHPAEMPHVSKFEERETRSGPFFEEMMVLDKLDPIDPSLVPSGNVKETKPYERPTKRPDDYQPFKFDVAAAKQNVGWTANCFSPHSQQKAFSSEMRVQRKLQRKKFDALRKRAARQRRLLEQNEKTKRCLANSDGSMFSNILTVTRKDFLAGRGCDCDNKTPHTHKVQPLEVVAHYLTVRHFDTHSELDIEGGPTLFPYRDYHALEHCRRLWVRWEREINDQHNPFMRESLWDVVFLHRKAKDVSARFGVPLGALYKACQRLCKNSESVQSTHSRGRDV
jgi:hypothetical protein